MSSRYVAPLTAVLLLTGQQAAAQTLFTGKDAVGGNANAGQAVYAQSCLGCHGPKLEGSPFAPTLLGETFMSHWRGRTPAELLTQMRNTMPPKGAGEVKPGAYPDLMAFLVKANLEGAPNLAVAPATVVQNVSGT